MLKVAAKKEAVKLPCSLHFSHVSTVMSGYLLSTVYTILSYDVVPESEITPCNKIDKPPVVYRFTGNVMTSITTMRT